MVGTFCMRSGGNGRGTFSWLMIGILLALRVFVARLVCVGLSGLADEPTATAYS